VGAFFYDWGVMRRGRPNFTKEEPEGHRINQQIRATRVRVIDGEGNQLGIMTVPEALDFSRNAGLDLVEVSPLARPPVCRIMDYGRFKYQQKKKTQEAKKNTKTIQVKEIKVRPKTDGHDLETKLRQAREFLEEGHKVKVTMRFRGREIIYAERAMEMLFSIGKEIAELGEIEQHPNLMGRNMSMLVVPKAKK
jgi:translation initiation factor IF-3